jgi:ribosomal protein S18 acetylase RimI-like enzyme
MLAAQYQITPTTRATVEQVKSLLSAALPVRYSDKFYASLTGDDGARISLEARSVADSALAGHVAWFVESAPPDERGGEPRRRLYLMALAVAATKRRLGIGSMFLSKATEFARQVGATSICLHVQVGNTDALEFYRRLGFRITSTVEGYYSRIEPPDAHVLTLEL